MPLIQKSWTAILVSLRKMYSVSVAGLPLFLEKFLLHLNKSNKSYCSLRVYYVLGPRVGDLHKVFCLIPKITTWGTCSWFAYFMDEETEAQHGELVLIHTDVQDSNSNSLTQEPTF